MPYPRIFLLLNACAAWRLRCVLAALALLPFAGRAAIFTVTSTNDAGAGTLRQALTSANGAAGADTIPSARTRTAVPAPPTIRN
jgi:hypothetical protein